MVINFLYVESIVKHFLLFSIQIKIDPKARRHNWINFLCHVFAIFLSLEGWTQIFHVNSSPFNFKCLYGLRTIRPWSRCTKVSCMIVIISAVEQRSEAHGHIHESALYEKEE